MSYAIIDANYLAIRSIHMGKNLINGQGIPTGGVFIFLKSLYKYLDHGSPIVVFDHGHSEFRKSIYPDYKKRAPIDPKDIDEIYEANKQFTFSCLPILLPKMGIPVIKIKGHEADDIIYVLAEHVSKTSMVTVVSDDQDYEQMINIGATVHKPMKEITVNRLNFEEINNYKPEYFWIWKCMVGDGSDNIDGCKGIGPVKAAKICNQLESPTLDAIYKWANSGSTKMHEIVKTGFPIIKRNKMLIDLSVAPINKELIISEFKRSIQEATVDFDYVMSKFRALEFTTLGQWIAKISIK